jgi:mRNA-degrading endonuclease RelE of RelBE toxin-antitoxin system
MRMRRRPSATQLTQNGLAVAAIDFGVIPRAQRECQRPAAGARRISIKMRFYAAQPDPLKFAEPLTGSNEYRFRVGDYRVIFEVINDALWVTAIKRRDEAYR